MDSTTAMTLVGWLEFNVPFQHKYGYIRDEAMVRNTPILHFSILV